MRLQMVSDDESHVISSTVGPPTDDATWKTLMHPYLKCMHQQLAVLKKHVSFCLVSRVAEGTFLLLSLALLTACPSHPLTAHL